MAKVQQIGGSLYIVLPRALASVKRIKAGDTVEWVEDNVGKLYLQPKQP